VSPIKVGFSGAEDSQFEPLPTDDYAATIFDVAMSDSPGPSGFHYLTFTFRISEGEFEGRQQWRNYSLSPRALWALKGLLRTLGYEIEEGKDFEFEPKEVMGRPVIIRVTEVTYQGNPSNDVAEVKPAGAPSGGGAGSGW
jgi:hypothetical protein